MRKKLLRWIASQFHHPRGLPGRLVGWEMALRPSNRKRNAWAVSLMDVQPSDRVFEIGFGPGSGVREIARRATRGEVVGIDHSAVMRAQAARRNAAAIRAGRVSLLVATVEEAPAFDRPFDKILAVNNLGMWSEPAVRLKELAGLLRRGGRIAIVSQPRTPGATAETTAATAREIVGLLDGGGIHRDPGRDAGPRTTRRVRPRGRTQCPGARVDARRPTSVVVSSPIGGSDRRVADARGGSSGR